MNNIYIMIHKWRGGETREIPFLIEPSKSYGKLNNQNTHLQLQDYWTLFKM